MTAENLASAESNVITGSIGFWSKSKMYKDFSLYSHISNDTERSDNTHETDARMLATVPDQAAEFRGTLDGWSVMIDSI